MNQRKPPASGRRVLLSLAVALTTLHASAELPKGPFQFVLPEQNLQSSLVVFSKTTGVQVLFPGGDLGKKNVPALTGNYSAQEALQHLLAGSGLQFRESASGTVTVIPSGGAEGGYIKLAPVVIQGERLADAPTKLPEVVITGARMESSSTALFAETPLIETPFSVSIYNQQLIEDQRAFTLKEVLQNDPSVAIQMPGGFYGNQNLALRGFRVDNFNGYRIDGLPIIHTVSPYLDDKSQVELLKGPAALRYGFMPPGGAINIVRKRPTPDFSTALQFDVNTFGNIYGQIDASDTVADGKFGYRVVLAGDQFDSFYDKADGNRLMGSLITEWNPSEMVTVWSAIGGQSLQRSGYYGPIISANGLLLDTGVKTSIMQDWARNEQDIFDAAAGTDIKFSANWKLRTSFNYQDTDRESRLTYPYSVMDNGDYTEGALLTRGPIGWQSRGWHLHLEGGFDTGSLRHDVIVGTQYRDYYTYGERSFPDVGPNNAYQLNPLPIPVGGPWRVIEAEYQELGFFATDTIKFNDHWSVLLGGRYGKYENIFPTDPASDDKVGAWSPTLALMYSPIEEVHTYFSYTQGLQDGGFANRFAANAWEPLGVQKSEQFELGVKTEWFGGRLAGELALFQIDQDLAMLDPNTNIDSFAGLQRHRGIELAVRGKITEHWQAGIATMLLDAEQVETGNPALDGMTPQHVPKYQVNLWSALDIPMVPGLTLAANARFVDKQYLDQMEQYAIDGYWVLDVGVRYQFKVADTRWMLRLNVQNALDNRYFESGEFYPSDAGYLAYGAPVSANFSLSLSF